MFCSKWDTVASSISEGWIWNVWYCCWPLPRIIWRIKRHPDLTNIATLNVDRGYLRINLLAWWLSHVLGTVMRQDFLSYTFGKTDAQTQKSGQLNIATETAKIVHQATLKHNFGKSSNKNHRLTCTGYSSGTSSTVNLGIHSEHHTRQFDLVAASPSDLKWYNDPSLTRYEHTMRAFESG